MPRRSCAHPSPASPPCSSTPCCPMVRSLKSTGSPSICRLTRRTSGSRVHRRAPGRIRRASHPMAPRCASSRSRSLMVRRRVPCAHSRRPTRSSSVSPRSWPSSAWRPSESVRASGCSPYDGPPSRWRRWPMRCVPFHGGSPVRCRWPSPAPRAKWCRWSRRRRACRSRCAVRMNSRSNWCRTPGMSCVRRWPHCAPMCSLPPARRRMTRHRSRYPQRRRSWMSWAASSRNSSRSPHVMSRSARWCNLISAGLSRQRQSD